MSFINNLGKGFVKSAVNQVGRDAGRQVSNAVFNGTASSKTGEAVNVSELVEVKGNTFWETVGILFLSWALPIIGGIICLFVGVDYYMKDFKKYYRIETKEIYVPDRRFKTGKRLDGHKDVRVYFKGPIDDKKRKGNILKGIVYILLSSIPTIYYSIKFYQYFSK